MGSRLEADLLRKMRDAGLPAPEREVRFDERRAWRFDFAWPDRAIAVEVEGGTHAGGRHVRGVGYEKDCEKYNAAALNGWLVLRFTGAMVRDGRACATVVEAFKRFEEGGDECV